MLLAKQNRMPEAVATFRRAAELSPNNPQTQLNLAAALERNGERDGAIEAYRLGRTSRAQLAQSEHAKRPDCCKRPAASTEAVPYLRQRARLKS